MEGFELVAVVLRIPKGAEVVGFLFDGEEDVRVVLEVPVEPRGSGTLGTHDHEIWEPCEIDLARPDADMAEGVSCFVGEEHGMDRAAHV